MLLKIWGPYPYKIFISALKTVSTKKVFFSIVDDNINVENFMNMIYQVNNLIVQSAPLENIQG